MGLYVRKMWACIEAPMLRPRKIVTMSMSGLAAVSVSRFTTPLTLIRLPNMSMPMRGMTAGTIRAMMPPQMRGKRTSSVLEHFLTTFILMSLSFFDVIARMIGAWMMGTMDM